MIQVNIDGFILHSYLLCFYKRKAYECGAVNVTSRHIYRRNLMVVICRVIVNSFVCVAAACINGDFIFIFVYDAATPLLIN